MTHRSWFSTIFIGLSVALLAVIAVVYKPSASPSDKSRVVNEDHTEVVEGVALTPSEYENAVRGVLSAYDASRDAASAYAVLVALRGVPAAYLTAHLDLVIAFGQLQAGNGAEGEERLAAARAAYSWLAH